MLVALRIRNCILIFLEVSLVFSVDLDITSFYDYFIVDLVYCLLQIDLWLRFKPRHFLS
jgi:hypothetical protein